MGGSGGSEMPSIFLNPEAVGRADYWVMNWGGLALFISSCSTQESRPHLGSAVMLTQVKELQNSAQG